MFMRESKSWAEIKLSQRLKLSAGKVKSEKEGI
ncbi:Uncharacterised protein [Bacteroides thetaiotaomicron]|nr:Uncharacterised protein [Bacteroides thetaiotaomicron]